MPKTSSIRSAVSIEHRLVTQTDGHRPTASTADAQHRAVKRDAQGQKRLRTAVLAGSIPDTGHSLTIRTTTIITDSDRGRPTDCLPRCLASASRRRGSRRAAGSRRRSVSDGSWRRYGFMALGLGRRRSPARR